MRCTEGVFVGVVALVAGGLLGGGGAAGACPRTGPELRVNGGTAGQQVLPAVAALAGGGWVVVWQSETSAGSDHSATSIQARLLDAAGVPEGDDLQVNTYTEYGQQNPAVAGLPDGGFVVAWDSDGSPGDDGSSFSVQVRRFGADGAPLGEQQQVNTYTASLQRYPAVASGSDGGFVVVWHSFGSSGNDDSSASVQGRWFDAGGAPLGDDVQLNTVTFHRQKYPAVAVAADGTALVVWQDEGTATIKGRRFGAAGVALGDETVVSSEVATFQERPRLAADGDGRWLVTWDASHSDGGDASGYSIKARRVGANGVPEGVDAQVNTVVAGMQLLPTVADGGHGEAVVVWQSEASGGGDGDGTSIQARVAGGDGGFAGDDCQVNGIAVGDQLNPRVAGDGTGLFLVVWHGDGADLGDDSGSAVLARTLDLSLFRDGFESGGVGAWSGVVGPGRN